MVLSDVSINIANAISLNLIDANRCFSELAILLAM